MKNFFLEFAKPTRVMNAVAAGLTNQTSDSVDLAGYDGVVFIALLGALTAGQVTKLKLQSSSDDGVADAYADIADTETAAMADADSNKMLVCDLRNPPERYVQAILERGSSNAVIDGVIAIPYHARELPQDVDADVSQSTKVIGA